MQLYTSIVPSRVINSKAGEDIVEQAIFLIKRSEKYAGGRYTAEGLIRDCSDGDSHLWVVTNEDAVVVSAIVTRFVEYENTKSLQIIATGGFNMKYWIDELMPKLHRFAMDCGADKAELIGRPGWARVLAKHGYKKTLVLLEADLVRTIRVKESPN